MILRKSRPLVSVEISPRPAVSLATITSYAIASLTPILVLTLDANPVESAMHYENVRLFSHSASCLFYGLEPLHNYDSKRVLSA